MGLHETHQPISLVALAPVLIFAADFVQVITARLIFGVPPWLGDRRHLTHVSANLGLPRVLIAPVFIGLGWVAFALLGVTIAVIVEFFAGYFESQIVELLAP